jgi:hypothetical protein
LLAQALADLRSVPFIIVLVSGQAAAFAISSAARGAIIPRIVPSVGHRGPGATVLAP